MPDRNRKRLHKVTRKLCYRKDDRARALYKWIERAVVETHLLATLTETV